MIFPAWLPTASGVIGDAAMVVAASTLVYLAKRSVVVDRTVTAINESLHGERGLVAAITRIEKNWERVNDKVQVHEVSIALLQKHEGPDRRRGRRSD